MSGGLRLAVETQRTSRNPPFVCKPEGHPGRARVGSPWAQRSVYFDNLKAAKTIGLDMPPSLLATANAATRFVDRHFLL